jgi:ABC-2 type transport system ATP-binding protein
MIELIDLTKRFDDFLAVDRASFSVQAGEILVLLGPNGAGKTTTVRMLAGILRPTAGHAFVAGYSVTEQAREVRRRVGLLTERPGLYLRMVGSEYLEFFGRLMGLDRGRTVQRARELLASIGMAEAWDQRIGTFSKGMRQKMALTRALLHDPPVLLLDEPTSAMDPQSAKLVRDAILSMRDGQRAVLICTHNLAEAEALADRIAIIRRGRIVALGTPEQLKAELLGPALMEVRLATSCDGVAGLVSDLVKVHSQGADWLRYTVSDPTAGNPRVIRALVAQGVEVVTVSEVTRSLEDVYLWAVEG